MGKLGNALILSPFATHPLDAGQRKRAFQTTSLLKEWGFSITFLHFAFETRWYWGHNSEDDAVLREQWEGDVLHFYANKNVGMPPLNSESHQLDEWWDEALGGYINNIFSKRQYDLFVVHNIWLSKAFDYAPYHCLKVLEMHDLFSQRAKEFEATGVPPEFFHCSEKDEVFGLRRADLLFAIKQEDAEWCKARELGKTQVISIPYVEQSSSQQLGVDPSTDVEPLHPGKVVFGMIGSDIHFNRHAVHALIKELDAVIRETYAPIEFFLAGSICRSVGECPVFVKKLGFVDQVSDFYTAVDVVMVPMLHGTGVKIKSVEALSYCKPVLFTAHSAEGTGYTGRACQSLAEMAHWAAWVALGGAIPIDLINDCRESLLRSRDWILEAKQAFLSYYKQKRPSFVQILAPSNSDPGTSFFETLLGLVLFKEMSSVFRANGICVHPSIVQYLVSVPGNPIGDIRYSRNLLDALLRSTFAIVSWSQLGLLRDISQYANIPAVMIDCRAITPRQLQQAIIECRECHDQYIILVTPFQASLLADSCDLRLIVYPLYSSRECWDPHLNPLFAEAKKNISMIPPHLVQEYLSQIHSSNGVNEYSALDSLFCLDTRNLIDEAVQQLCAYLQSYPV